MTEPFLIPVEPDPEQFHYEPCDECGKSVLFPRKIRPGKEVAKCDHCGVCYIDATEEENAFLNRRDKDSQET